MEDRGVEFDSCQGQAFSLVLVVQTGSGAHPTSHTMDTGHSLSGDKTQEGNYDRIFTVIIHLNALTAVQDEVHYKLSLWLSRIQRKHRGAWRISQINLNLGSR
jgi:hypothetical protein